jgi:hypothetical protein
MENCKSCRFSSDEPVFDRREEMYACQRFPPQIILNNQGEVISLFPTVRPTSRCGEYK